MIEKSSDNLNPFEDNLASFIVQKYVSKRKYNPLASHKKTSGDIESAFKSEMIASTNQKIRLECTGKSQRNSRNQNESNSSENNMVQKQFKSGNFFKRLEESLSKLFQFINKSIQYLT